MKYQRSPFVKFDDIPGLLPADSQVPSDADLQTISRNAVCSLNDLHKSSLASVAIWRDLLAFTGTYRTFYSALTVFATWANLSRQNKRSIIRIKGGREPRVGHGGNGISWIDVDVLFTAQHQNLPENCMGTVSIALEADGIWRIWMLRTWLECFDGRGHPDVIDTHLSAQSNGTSSALGNGAETSDPDVYNVIIVGGGQCGLSTAGRLQALGLRYVLLERNQSVGDTWVNRYESLRWHTSKECGNLPFGHTFPAEDDYLLPTKRIGAGHKAWAEKYGINVRTGAKVERARWNERTKLWTVDVHSTDGRIDTLTSRNLVLSIGTGHATPVYPPWATADVVEKSGFKGTVLHSFAGYKNSRAWAGKRGIVIGTANTAHDIAEDMANAGMETTIVQRNSTFVFPAEWLHAAEDRYYTADKLIDVSDRQDFTYPNKIQREVINNHVWAGIRASPERFDALEKVGFKLDRFGDTYNHLYVRLGGHYVDIGASARIAKGEIKLKTAPVKGLTVDGLQFEDGSEVGADLIVLCTGFDHDFRNDAERLIGKDAAERMDNYWGTDKEGELRAHAKPAGHPNLYYFGGDTRMGRFFSRFLALQIQADALGQPFVPYLD